MSCEWVVLISFSLGQVLLLPKTPLSCSPIPVIMAATLPRFSKPSYYPNPYFFSPSCLSLLHELPGCLLNDLLQTGAVARMKPRMVSMAGATALLLHSSDCLSFWLGAICITQVNNSCLSEELYNFIVLLMLLLSDGFSKALLSFELFQGLGLVALSCSQYISHSTVIC